MKAKIGLICVPVSALLLFLGYANRASLLKLLLGDPDYSAKPLNDNPHIGDDEDEQDNNDDDDDENDDNTPETPPSDSPTTGQSTTEQNNQSTARKSNEQVLQMMMDMVYRDAPGSSTTQLPNISKSPSNYMQAAAAFNQASAEDAKKNREQNEAELNDRYASMYAAEDLNISSVTPSQQEQKEEPAIKQKVLTNDEVRDLMYKMVFREPSQNAPTSTSTPALKPTNPAPNSPFIPKSLNLTPVVVNENLLSAQGDQSNPATQQPTPALSADQQQKLEADIKKIQDILKINDADKADLRSRKSDLANTKPQREFSAEAINETLKNNEFFLQQGDHISPEQGAFGIEARLYEDIDNLCQSRLRTLKSRETLGRYFTTDVPINALIAGLQNHTKEQLRCDNAGYMIPELPHIKRAQSKQNSND